MIIDESEEPSSSVKSPTEVSSTAFNQTEAGVGPLQQLLPPPYVSYQAVLPPVVTSPPRRQKQRWARLHKTRRRLAFASIALNCLFFLLLLRITRRERTTERMGRDKHGDTDITIPPILPVIPVAKPDPRSGKCVASATWSNATFISPDDDSPFNTTSHASFTFPDASSAMFLIAQGAQLGGHLQVVTTSPHAFPRVDIQARYCSARVLDRSAVCQMEQKKTGSVGLGIFTPHAFDGQSATDALDFTITLFLPTSSDPGSNSPVYNLETNLPQFSQSFDALRDVVRFDQLKIEGRGKPIYAKSVFANNATVMNANAKISGSFETSSSLILSTTNAPVLSSIKLHHRNIFKTTHLRIETCNAEIDAPISLFTTAANGQGGRFNISATTTNAPMTMTFPSAPARSILHLDAETKNSPASVWLNEAFEGDFTLFSNVVLVDQLPYVDIRKLRTVDWQSDLKRLGFVKGEVRWKMPILGGAKKPLGSVRISTNNSFLKLHV
ncbi:unnamed protein product [Mycena citricolor]|uniref:Uncharacterized protein n=1 Tax=Mycena citricolor TaxID=2018698 RepID=A0AAD2HTI9_9AGAR|nr:unnamed protein product [Mycena citricolor]